MKNYNEKEILSQKLTAMFPDKKTKDQAIAILAGYGTEPSEPEPDRVRLAILKLAGADMDCLQETTIGAKRDYRDVLAWAEYPNQTIARALPDGHRKEKLIQIDLKQYEDWLLNK